MPRPLDPPPPPCLPSELLLLHKMDEFADAMMENFPEILARDLAEQENVSMARSRTSGRPSVELAYETQPPNLPQRNPSRLSHRFHQVDSETFLCSLKQNSVESAWRSERETILKNVACHHSTQTSFRLIRRDHMPEPTNHLHMKQDTEQDARRLFLNGTDEGWGSDSSADANTGHSPSVRTRKQSITTAATSVDFQLGVGEKGMEEYSTEPCSVGGPSTGQHGEGYPVGSCHSDAYSTGPFHQESNVSCPDKMAAWQAWNEGGSWVDFGEQDTDHIGEDRGGFNSRRHGQQIDLLQHPRHDDSPRHQGGDSSHVQSDELLHAWDGSGPPHYPWGDHELPTDTRDGGASSHTQAGSTEQAMFMADHEHQSARNQTFGPEPTLVPSVPERRSSLSHQVTTVDTTQLGKNAPHNLPQDLASRLLLPASPTSPRDIHLHHHSGKAWEDTGAAVGPVVPTGRHQAHHNLQLDLSTISPDQLSLPPLSAGETTPYTRSHRDRSFSLRSQNQQPNLLSKPRKSHSITKAPKLNIHNWLESNTRARQQAPPVTMAPIAMSPTSSVRVSGHVLETLRINVQNFPDTMLRTSSVTIDHIRDYSHKVKRSDGTRQLVPARESDEITAVAPQSPTSPSSPSLGRKTSFSNLKSSLRGKFSRFTSSSSPSINELSEPDWPPIDSSTVGTGRCDSPPLQPVAARDAACIQALRCILPRGSPYLLDGLYAHIIAYNYINSICGSLPELEQNVEGPRLRTRPSRNAILPAGVTSLADLRVQEDVSDAMVKEFQDDINSITSKNNNVVPSKAAFLLGLGSNNMSKPTKPAAGPVGGCDKKVRKTCPTGGFKGHYLESDSAMRSLREDIAHNIQRLIDTAESSSSAQGMDTEEVQDSNVVRQGGKQPEPIVMRALSEVVRCYEELSC